MFFQEVWLSKAIYSLNIHNKLPSKATLYGNISLTISSDLYVFVIKEII